MKAWELPTGYVRVLVQCDQHDTLVQAANDMLEGRSPAEQMRVYADANAKHDFVVDTEFGAVPIWDGADRRPAISVNDRGKKARSLLALDKSRKFLIRAYVAPASL